MAFHSYKPAGSRTEIGDAAQIVAVRTPGIASRCLNSSWYARDSCAPLYPLCVGSSVTSKT